MSSRGVYLVFRSAERHEVQLEAEYEFNRQYWEWREKSVFPFHVIRRGLLLEDAQALAVSADAVESVLQR